MSHDYDIGDKVVCVDDKFPLGIEKFYTALPKKDSTYVVRDIQLGVALVGGKGEVSVLLVGLINPVAYNSKAKKENGFAAWRFRKPGTLPPVAEAVFSPRDVKVEPWKEKVVSV